MPLTFTADIPSDVLDFTKDILKSTVIKMVELLNGASGGASQIGSRIYARFQGNSTKGRKMDIQASIQPIPNMLSSSFPFLLRLRRIATSAAAFSRFMLNIGSISFSFIGAYKS